MVGKCQGQGPRKKNKRWDIDSPKKGGWQVGFIIFQILFFYTV